MKHLPMLAAATVLFGQPIVALAQVAATQQQGSGLSQIMLSFALGIASGLSVAWIRGWRPSRRTYEEIREHDVVDFHRRLGAHIADTPSPGTTEVEVRARTIVSLRDEYLETLIALQNSLNSDITILSAQLRDLDGLSRAPARQQRIRAAIEQTLEVLRKKWPDKEASISALVRKLRTEAGQKEQ
jgi:hypothetical protein